MTNVTLTPTFEFLGAGAEHEAHAVASSRSQALRRALFLGGFGVLAGIAGALSLSLAIGALVAPPFRSAKAAPYESIIVAAAVIRMAIFIGSRPDRHRRHHGYFDEVIDASKQALIGSLAIVLFTFFWRDGMAHRDFSYSRYVFVLSGLVSVVLLSVVAVAAKSMLGRLRRHGFNSTNIVIMGANATSKAFEAEIDAHPETGYRVVGKIGDDKCCDGDAVNDLRVLATMVHVDEVVMCSAALSRDDIHRIMSLPELSHTEIVAAPHLFGLPPTKVRLAPVGNFPLLSLGHEPLPGARKFVKRAIDVAVALAALLATLPLSLGAALAVKLTSSGPVLFKQKRIGMDGRPFEVLKFRTMRAGASTAIHQAYVTAQLEKAETELGDGLQKLTNDPRITPVGAILRKLSIDELPQLINVLRGDMSLVGPRPALAFEVDLYTNRQRRRLDVRPGMTGLWQVSGRNRLPILHMLELDAQYAERWTFSQDLKILLRTIPALLRREAI